MASLFTENTVKTIKLPNNSCLLNYSVLNEFYSPSPFRSFSIKYVVDGSELYSVNGTRYVIKNREYLLANQYSEGFVEVDSKRSVSGICIDIAPEILSEVVASYLRPDTSVSDIELDRFFNSAGFIENKYAVGTTHLGECLLELEKILTENPSYDLSLNKEFYYTLSEKIILDYIPVFKRFQSIKAIKTETKKELLKKMDKAKEYIDVFYAGNYTVEHIAKEVGLSEYHFFRLFKTIYSLSPHQYIIQKRLMAAKDLIVKERLAIASVAHITGFSDIYSFSKSFKKFFGFSPSKLC